MAKSAAQAGYGATFGVKQGSASVYTVLAEVTSITPPGMTRETIDVTHLTSDDQFKEFIGSLAEAGEATLSLNYIPSASDALMTAFTTDHGAGSFQITFPKGDFTMTFNGVVTGYEPGEIVVDGKLTASMTVKASGKPVIAAKAGG